MSNQTSNKVQCNQSIYSHFILMNTIFVLFLWNIFIFHSTFLFIYLIRTEVKPGLLVINSYINKLSPNLEEAHSEIDEVV